MGLCRQRHWANPSSYLILILSLSLHHCATPSSPRLVFFLSTKGTFPPKNKQRWLIVGYYPFQMSGWFRIKKRVPQGVKDSLRKLPVDNFAWNFGLCEFSLQACSAFCLPFCWMLGSPTVRVVDKSSMKRQTITSTTPCSACLLLFVVVSIGVCSNGEKKSRCLLFKNLTSPSEKMTTQKEMEEGEEVALQRT